MKTIADICEEAVKTAESHDFMQTRGLVNQLHVGDDKDKTTDGKGGGLNRERTLLSASDQEESWVNINRDGHWNRLHTHSGACWSGVYYIKSDRQCLLREYSGQLILKPTCQPLESDYKLNDVEKQRLIGNNVKNGNTHEPSRDICDYIEIPAEEGIT